MKFRERVTVEQILHLTEQETKTVHNASWASRDAAKAVAAMICIRPVVLAAQWKKQPIPNWRSLKDRRVTDPFRFYQSSLHNSKSDSAGVVCYDADRVTLE